MLAKFVAISEALSPDAIAKDLDALGRAHHRLARRGRRIRQPLAFNPDHLRALLNSASWIVKAVREAMTDLDDNGRVKN